MPNNDDDGVPKLPEMTRVQQKAFDATVGSVQRIAMRIVALPKENRERAFAVARENFEEAIRRQGFEGHPDAEQWLNKTVEGLRVLVAEIEASGGAAGGRA
jgi:hypothetical protein